MISGYLVYRKANILHQTFEEEPSLGNVLAMVMSQCFGGIKFKQNVQSSISFESIEYENLDYMLQYRMMPRILYFEGEATA